MFLICLKKNMTRVKGRLTNFLEASKSHRGEGWSGVRWVLRSIIARATKNIQLGRSPRMSIESTTPINGASIVGERCVSNSFEKGFFGFWMATTCST